MWWKIKHSLAVLRLPWLSSVNPISFELCWFVHSLTLLFFRLFLLFISLNEQSNPAPNFQILSILALIYSLFLRLFHLNRPPRSFFPLGPIWLLHQDDRDRSGWFPSRIKDGRFCERGSLGVVSSLMTKMLWIPLEMMSLSFFFKVIFFNIIWQKNMHHYTFINHHSRKYWLVIFLIPPHLSANWAFVCPILTGLPLPIPPEAVLTHHDVPAFDILHAWVGWFTHFTHFFLIRVI